MAKTKSTRRSISVKGISYQRLKDYCDATGESVSGWLEEVIEEKMDAAGVPAPTVVKVPVDRGPSKNEQAVDQYFTF